jgi:hypothetical protein
MSIPVQAGSTLTQIVDRRDRPAGRATARPQRVALAADEAAITIRRAAPGAPEVRDLAELDSVRVPAGDVLVAEVGGEPVAAIALDGAPAFANPFRPTATVVALLEARAAQVRGVAAPAWGRRRHRRLRARLGGAVAS